MPQAVGPATLQPLKPPRFQAKGGSTKASPSTYPSGCALDQTTRACSIVSRSGAVRTRKVHTSSSGTPRSRAMRSPPTLALMAIPEPRPGDTNSTSASSDQRRARRRAPRCNAASALPFGRIEESLSATGAKTRGTYRTEGSLGSVLCSFHPQFSTFLCGSTQSSNNHDRAFAIVSRSRGTPRATCVPYQNRSFPSTSLSVIEVDPSTSSNAAKSSSLNA